ncbi:UNVERIFIED_CONTAM: protein PTST, chloroplastic [Sesamum latifolium]|uniref:Protein PTST, chloroplastic n=1 Tax=Sesamum latifolium TaxID=2727402 RepID=A0AAW2Y857_9LAMI
MECKMLSSAVQPCLARMDMKRIDRFQVKMTVFSGKRLNNLNRVLMENPVHYERWRVFCNPLKALLADSQRSKLIKKLSEANQQNRLLKRQLQVKDDALVSFKRELAIIDQEIKALVRLAEEIASYSIPDGSRKINGKYIQSHLLSRLEAVLEKCEQQIKDVNAAQARAVQLSWNGVAENVQVMGSFDGWSQGEHMSPEYNGSYATFSTTLMLRPGRYEIKFLVDGDWQLSPEFPTVGEGMLQNNLLIVE